jgi:hypothetical protein
LEEYIVRSIADSIHLLDERTLGAPSAQIREAAQYAVAPPQRKLTEASLMQVDEHIPLLDPENYSVAQHEKYSAVVSNIQRSLKISEQFKEFGVDATNLFYKHARKITGKYVSPKDIDIAKTDMMADYPLIREFFQAQEDNAKSQEVIGKMSKLEKELILRIGEKRMNISVQDEKVDKARAKLNSETSAKMVAEQFEMGYEYLNSLIPQEERKRGDKVPYYILKLSMGLRKIFPVANTEVLAQIWWQLRLGGVRAKDIYEHLKREMPDYVKANKLKKYSEHLADNYLSSEAAGFEFQKEVKVVEGVTPNGLIFQTMKDLIQHHIPKNQEYVRFTLIEGEQNIRKIVLPYHEGITDSEINANIKSALLTNRWTQLNLTERERADLSYKGYSAKEREKDKKYQQVYKGFGVDEKTKEEYSGDYIIQIGSTFDSTRDPRSLFAVDSHKAAIQLQIKEAGKVAVTARYNHSYFDGVPADTHSKEVFTGISQLDATDAPGILSLSENSVSHYLTQAIESAVESHTSALPIIEARADYEDTSSYEKKVLGDSAIITPIEMRGLVVARANGIQYYQHLVGGPDKGAYFSRNPNSNNIQPVVIAPSTLTKNTAETWARRVRMTVKRAKESVGDVALFSSVAGTKEGLLAVAGTRLNPRLTNMLRHAQGMVSAFVGKENGATFTTAISNGYLPPAIDLNNPVPSMGVLGMYIHEDGTAHYTTRLLPSQAQQYFRKAALDLCWPHLAEDGQRLVLNEFNKIISAWDQLVGGGIAGKKAITLKEYEQIRDTVLHDLAIQGLIHDEGKIETGEKLQMYLNETLQYAARDILNEEKLRKARMELDEIMAVN